MRKVLVPTVIVALVLGIIGGAVYSYFSSHDLEIYGDNSAEHQHLPAEKHGNLTVLRDPDRALEVAGQKNLPIFLDFYADWCTNCVKFQSRMLEHTALNAALQKVVVLQIHDTDRAYDRFAKDGRFDEINMALPLFAVLNAKGELIWKGQDYTDDAAMISAMRKAAGQTE